MIVEGMNFYEARVEADKVEEVIAVLEWYLSTGRELLTNNQLSIHLGDRKVSPEAVLRVQSDLLAMIGAHRLQLQMLGTMYLSSKEGPHG